MRAEGRGPPPLSVSAMGSIDRSNKCVAPKPCGYRLFDCLSGEFDGFLDTLVAQTFKSGAA